MPVRLDILFGSGVDGIGIDGGGPAGAMFDDISFEFIPTPSLVNAIVLPRRVTSGCSGTRESVMFVGFMVAVSD